MTEYEYAIRVQRGYQLANLVALLVRLREPDRYPGANGNLELTTGELGLFDAAEAELQLRRAVEARRCGDADHRLAFSNPRRGLSHGLNPYTDWSLSCLEERPRHTYLFLGLDFYSVADLAQEIGWSQYLLDPFGGDWDPYWHRLWAWILMRTRDGNKGKDGVRAQVWQQVISASEAAAFIQDDGGAFVFHNLIPYLRPACVAKTGKNWPEQELRKPSIRACIVEDLRLIRETAVGPIVAYCTKQATAAFLKEAGFPVEDIVCWGAHPSVPYRFTPSALYVRRSIYFKRKNCQQHLHGIASPNKALR